MQETSNNVLRSLPWGIWETFGASGWGPNGSQSFMQYDYGTVSAPYHGKSVVDWGASNVVSSSPLQPKQSRVRHLFEGNSCQWTQYYDEDILLKIKEVYKPDYDLFGWYQVEKWVERWRFCSKIGGGETRGH